MVEEQPCLTTREAARARVHAVSKISVFFERSHILTGCRGQFPANRCGIAKRYACECDAFVAARQLSNEVQRRAFALATLLEPLLIVAMGAVVLMIVLSVLLPIIQLNDFVK